MMRCLAIVAVITFVALAACQTLAGSPEKAREAFVQGQAFLAQGDFDAALSAFKKAAKGLRSNEEYAQRYALVRQVVQMRENLPRERSSERWLSDAATLHAFYHENGLFAESVPLDKERLRRAPSPESAILLAETQLALKMNSEVASVLASLPSESQSPHTNVLHALALARTGHLDRARAIVPVGDQPGIEAPEYFLDLARVQATLDQPQEALRALKRSIELTPPSRLEAHKAHLSRSTEFAGLADTPAFAEVMKTASVISESPCSGGAGCSKCPKRSKCGSSKPAQAPEKQ